VRTEQAGAPQPAGPEVGRQQPAGAPGRTAGADEAWLDLRDAGREAALAALFDAHHAQLVRLAALLGAGADAEDVVADAFCALHRRWDRLRSPEAALAYTRSCVVNLTRMRLRHLQVVRRSPDPVEGRAASAESQVMAREDQRAVVRALAALPDRQREAVVLRYWLDLREAEVAAAMGISAGAVKTHTSRAMAALTRALGSPS
jgi:RNA polymerase sigma-70 factor (sigma-E family)